MLKIVSLIASLILYSGAGVSAQTPRIWDINIGMRLGDLPSKVFVEPSCGNRGGPQGKAIGMFDQFLQCAPEASGLREIWFSYDDTDEFIALAHRQPWQRKTTSILDQPVILSVLIDSGGFIQGYRIYTDARANQELRQHAHELSIHFKARFNLDSHCENKPAENRETPIGGQFIKEICHKEENGHIITTETKFFYRPGQQFFDPNTGIPMANSFESSAKLEVIQVNRTYDSLIYSITPRAKQIYASNRAAFIAGDIRDCPLCNLSELDFRYRDLSGSNLSGANLKNSILHKTNLRNANLSSAILDGANLNRANISYANFSNASLVNAMLYQAEAARADFSSADLSRSFLGKMNSGFSKFINTNFDYSDLSEVRFNDSEFTGASLNKAYLHLASLLRSNLSYVTAVGAVMTDIRLRDSNLSRSKMFGTDLSRADLVNVNFSGADLRGVKLVSADMSKAQIDGANLTRTIMPDNSIRD